MKRFYLRTRMVRETAQELSTYHHRVSVTLNTFGKDKIKLRKYVEKLICWLRRYCFGISFMKDELRLKAIGATEVGTVNQGLHMHLVIGYENSTTRNKQDILNFIKRKWYALHKMNIKFMKLKFHKLMDFREIYDLTGSLMYLTKTIYHSHQFNLQYF
ncbi:MAG TPA: hypothetical protein VK958_00785 [Methylophilus sp.]|uniref:hypothetical protein n=1 Tax=Methylophilus sp. TaxID=29541 RepID=UPI002CC3C38C|nr:hypothetical protein [Methylophilus sp.]HSH85764.1 hypothetical protein [Methylophilus sp.]